MFVVLHWRSEICCFLLMAAKMALTIPGELSNGSLPLVEKVDAMGYGFA